MQVEKSARMSRICGWFLACFVVLAAAAWAGPVGGHTSEVMSLGFNAASTVLASGDQDGHVKLWRMPDMAPLREWSAHNDGVTAIAFSRDGKLMFTGGMDRYVKVWQVDSGKNVATLGPHSDDVLFVALSPDGRRLAAASYDGATVVWDVEKRQRLPFRLKGHTVDWSRDGHLLATATIDGSLHLYNAADGKEVAVWKAHKLCPNVARFSPGGHTLVSCVDHVKVWDVTTHRLLADLDPQLHSTLTGASWSGDGRHLIASSLWFGGARWDQRGNAWVRAPLADGTRVQHAAYSPNGKWIAIGNLHGSVDLVNAATGRIVVKRLGHVTAHKLLPRSSPSK